jgi:hypothetical protein
MSMEPAPKVTLRKRQYSRPKGGTKQYAKSQITNGNELLHGLTDGRNVWARRARDIIAEFLSDFPEPTAGERLIIRRIATLVVVVEQFETDFANAGGALGSCCNSKPLDLYQRAVGNLRRLVESLGIKGRRPIDVTPTLAEFAAEIYAARRQGDTP